MSEKKPSCSCVQNVSCCVKDCKFHSENGTCGAGAIRVSNEKARRKAETFCSTFENRASC